MRWCGPAAGVSSAVQRSRRLCRGRLLLQPFDLRVGEHARQRNCSACACTLCEPGYAGAHGGVLSALRSSDHSCLGTHAPSCHAVTAQLHALPTDKHAAWRKQVGAESGPINAVQRSWGLEGAPIWFWRPMGFWKKMTEATITITRFRQLPMECVTGDTRCRIMYDTCALTQRSEQTHNTTLACALKHAFCYQQHGPRQRAQHQQALSSPHTGACFATFTCNQHFAAYSASPWSACQTIAPAGRRGSRRRPAAPASPRSPGPARPGRAWPPG